jgi:threonine dehydrogenase-like Zn-dependent dehydrogenase
VLEVELAGICGSDLHGYRGHPGPRVPPLVLGHEVVGHVGGERYTVYPLIGCGHCPRCQAGEENLCPEWRLLGMHRPGVFAERVAVPESALVAIPAGLEPRRAVLTEPLACAVAALDGYALEAGRRVAVIGCGPIGLLSVAIASAAGAEVLALDPVPERRAVAERLGAASSAEQADRGASFDLVVDAAGFAATWRIALDLAAPGGDVAMLGLGEAEGSFPMALLVRRAIRLRGQFAYTRAQFSRALDMLGGGLGEALDGEWLSVAPLAEGAEAFEHLVRDPAHYIKVLLAPQR